MTGFEAAAATAEYLRSIDPGREARAIAYTQGAHWILLWALLLKILADWLILRMRLLERVRDGVQRTRLRPKLAAFCCVSVFLLANWVILLPWAIYAEWAREISYGLSSQPLVPWIAQGAIVALFAALFLGLLATPVYALIRRSGRRWWRWSSLVVVVFAFVGIVVGPVAFGSLFNTAKPVPAGPVRTAVVALARDAGIPSDRIVVSNSASQTNRYTATVVGGPGFATIELSDEMLRSGADLAEVRAVVAHEIGHYVHHHLMILALVVAFLGTCGLWAVDRTFPYIARLAGRPDLSIGDPAGAPALHMALVTFMLLTSPIIVTAQRAVENDADMFGLSLANEPSGAARSLLRTVDFRASRPSALEETLFYDHPSIAHRIERAMQWKAVHPGQEGALR
ncbi:STE24 endopeptidase [Sphingobium sp. AP50]|uniref:M48 family metalloprotease n=1 Tax=Sphingobium sp. AP50 TaxID=1884369 RepID=UPI0008B991BF|nr:M48 family metalloprotease [Sphingobium sp. AP50]SEJ82117.1 STE24 endopeptidase [Sphingobium sp. AP50]